MTILDEILAHKATEISAAQALKSTTEMAREAAAVAVGAFE